MKSHAALANGGGGGIGEEDDGEEQKNSDHFEGDPRPLPYAFEKELIQNANKHVRICETFGPPNRVYPITSKFHTKSEQLAPQAAQRHRLSNNNKLSSDHPLLESQMYGWIPLQCREASGNLNGIHAPKRRCCMTIHGEHIIAGRITERPPFNGLQFILH